MDKTTKKTFTIFTLLTIPSLVLSGNASIDKSAQIKSSDNGINSIELISQSFTSEYHNQEQKLQNTKNKCNEMKDYAKRVGYGNYTRINPPFLGKNNGVYAVAVTASGEECKVELLGYIGRPSYSGKSCIEGARCSEWKIEGDELCEYYRYSSSSPIRKECETKRPW